MELNFAVIDVVLILIICIAVIRGAFKGFIAEIGSVAAVVLSIGGAIIFTKPLSEILMRYFGGPIWSQIIAFLVLFIIIYLLVKLLENLLHSIFERLNLNRLDRVLGFFLGLAEGLLLSCVVMLILIWQPFFDVHGILDKSFFAEILFPLLPTPDRVIDPEVLLENA